MRMMRKNNSKVQEEGFHLLLPHAEDYIGELLEAFAIERDIGLRCWLLELIGEARSEKAFDVLSENLYSSNESFRSWAIAGLKNLNSKASRKLLFEAGITI